MVERVVVTAEIVKGEHVMGSMMLIWQ